MHATLNEYSMYDRGVLTEPQIRPLLHARLFCLDINMGGIWKVHYILHSVVFVGFYWISLLYCCGDISYSKIC